MRFVIYDDESMEPITVISLPGVAERDIWERMNGRVSVHVPKPITFKAVEDHETPSRMDIVELRFERFVRKGVVSLMCFTREAELALLLEPEWLPGQRRRVSELENHSKRLESLFMRAMGF